MAIVCRNLWMVFGARAAQRYGEVAISHPTRDARAEALIAQGLIPAVRDVSFDVARSELFVIMGLSGSGKSTLVRCLARLLEPAAGEVLIEGEDILAANAKAMIDVRRHTMGMVFQHFGLFPNMNVRDNVAFPLRVQGISRRERLARAEEVIDLVGLADKSDVYPRQLSGGQQQRVGIARSLAVNPAIWFLDEPFSALDPLIRRQLQDEFLRLQAALHKSIVFVTHDFSEAMRIADRIAIMRDGSIVQVGTPAEIVLSPVDAYVADFARDIPKGRVMKVESLMDRIADGGATGPQSTAGDFGSAPRLSAGMPLENALLACANGYVRLPVVDGDGKVVGVLTADALVRAIGRPDEAASDTAEGRGAAA